MKRFAQSTLLLSLLLAPVSAFAQTDTTTGTTDTTTGTTTSTPVNTDDGFDWGWLGLLGLAGLAGLRRRDDRAHPTSTTATDRR
ncbi:WGxxGxxG family protein [Deinococcus marmoris]|uniref:WGxxGxxG family protein n=1 Tax=Deinococcus marmoris TaxID=249408 RepID=UPI000497AAEB|nr:WGxxGxxG family protein [Deinococcus marmoris]